MKSSKWPVQLFQFTHFEKTQNYKKPDLKQSKILLFGDPKEDDIDAILKQGERKY